MNSFQTIILGIFGLFIIAGFLVIATVKARGGPEVITISMWGSMEREAVEGVAREFLDDKKLKLSYTEVSETSLDEKLLEALAAGRGPDMLLLPLELLLRYKDKIQQIPYATYTERTYKDTFIQEGDLFLSPQGIYALPFSVNPLVMYFNRDLLDEAGMPEAPRFWDEFLLLGQSISTQDDSGDLSQSAVALGEYRNIHFAREILAALFLQGGNPIVRSGPSGTRVTLSESGMSAILDFYTEFANPLKPSYSWNRSLPPSREAFLASNLAVYFGLGSEYADIEQGNPNLNFDIALFPRPRSASVGITYGKLTGVALLRVAKNPGAAFEVAHLLTSVAAAKRLSAGTNLPPVQRSLLAEKPTDAYGAILYDSAIRARGFLDPNPKVSAQAFATMVESVTNGEARSGEALQRAQKVLQAAVR